MSLDRGDYRIATSRSRHGVPLSATPSSRRPGPGASTSRGADALGVDAGPERGGCRRARTIAVADGTVVQPEQVLGPAAPGRTICITGDTAPVARVPRRRRERRFARPRGDLLRRRARAGARDATLDRARGRPGRGRGRRAAAGADAPLLALLRRRDRRKRRARSSPDTCCSAGLRRDRHPVPGAGRPRLVKGGALDPDSRPDAVQSAPE